MKSIVIENLCKQYGEKRVVDNLSLEINEGELFSLLGLNGAGKTTTIKMLSCLIPSSGGDAKMFGHSINSDSAKIKEFINISPQETAVAPNLTVQENLEFITNIYGQSKIQAKESAILKMQEFKLSDRAKDKAKVLSGGLQRRLSIAMSLISNPKILFLDEPTLGLDIKARHELWDILTKLKGKMTIILTTHYLEEAEYLSDRLCIIDNGKLKAVGTMDELKKISGKDNIDDVFLSLTKED